MCIGNVRRKLEINNQEIRTSLWREKRIRTMLAVVNQIEIEIFELHRENEGIFLFMRESDINKKVRGDFE